MNLPDDADTRHWIDQLQTNPGFAMYEAALAGEFERSVTALLDAEPKDPAVVQQLIGELRALRHVMRLPSRLARLARETTE